MLALNFEHMALIKTHNIKFPRMIMIQNVVILEHIFVDKTTLCKTNMIKIPIYL